MARKSKFSEAQIVDAVREVEGGAAQADVARRLGVSAQTIMSWRQTYSGMTTSDVAEKRRLDDENRKLRHLVAQQALDIAALKAALGKSGDALRATGGRLALKKTPLGYARCLRSPRLRRTTLASTPAPSRRIDSTSVAVH